MVINYILLLFIIIVTFNIILVILDKVTNKGIYRIEKFNMYPLFPNKYYKIAIYGGSAAAGYNANVNFSTILNFEIDDKNLTEKKPYIMNFAASGQPFQSGQSIIAMEFIKYFDLTIIYAGNNEHAFFLSHIFAKGLKSFQQSTNEWNSVCRKRFSLISRIFNIIISSNHTTSFAKKVLNRLISKYKANKGLNYKKNERDVESHNNRNENMLLNLNFKMLTKNPVLTKEARKNNIDLFCKSVEELCEESDGKSIFVVEVVNNDLYSPNQSYINLKSDEEYQNLEQKIIEIRTAINLSIRYDKELNNDIIKCLNNLYVEYPEIPALNHLMALTKIFTYKSQDSIQYFYKCFNDDFPIVGRVNQQTSSELKKICDKYSNCNFISTYEKFSIYLHDYKSYNQLFSDVQHPSSLGHILIAYSILSAFNWQGKRIDDYNHLLSIEKSYYKKIRLADASLAENTLLCFRWHLSCLIMVSDKHQYLQMATYYLEQWQQLTYRTICSSNYYFWKAIISANYHEVGSAIKYLKISIGINENNFHKLTNSTGANGILWREHLAKLNKIYIRHI